MKGHQSCGWGTWALATYPECSSSHVPSRPTSWRSQGTGARAQTVRGVPAEPQQWEVLQGGRAPAEAFNDASRAAVWPGHVEKFEVVEM